jgi:hypothetical protein
LAWRSPGSHCPTAHSASQSTKPGEQRNLADQITTSATAGYWLFWMKTISTVFNASGLALCSHEQPEYKGTVEVIRRRGIPIVGSLPEPRLRKQPLDVTQRVQPVERRKNVFVLALGLRAMQHAGSQRIRQEAVGERNIAKAIWGTRANPAARLQYAFEVSRDRLGIAEVFEGEIRQDQIDRAIRQWKLGTGNHDGAVDRGIRRHGAVDIDADDLLHLALEARQTAPVGDRIIDVDPATTGAEIHHHEIGPQQRIDALLELDRPVVTVEPARENLGQQGSHYKILPKIPPRAAVVY